MIDPSLDTQSSGPAAGRSQADGVRIRRTLTFSLRPAFVLRVMNRFQRNRFQRVAGFDRAIALASGARPAPATPVPAASRPRLPGEPRCRRSPDRRRDSAAGSSCRKCFLWSETPRRSAFPPRRLPRLYAERTSTPKPLLAAAGFAPRRDPGRIAWCVRCRPSRFPAVRSDRVTVHLTFEVWKQSYWGGCRTTRPRTPPAETLSCAAATVSSSCTAATRGLIRPASTSAESSARRRGSVRIQTL